MMKVAISKTEGYYPATFPFNPDQKYPEYKGEISDKPNYVYRAVRKNFEILGYDKENFNTEEWNPLRNIISPGNRVFIKPNFVAHRYRASCPKQASLYSVVTHPSVIRSVLDYIAIALKGEGEIVIGDNPSIDADFNKLVRASKLDLLAQFYTEEFNTRCRVLDLRECRCDDLEYYGFKSMMKELPGDPEGYSVINLGEKSLFYGMSPLLFRAIYTKRWETIKHHHGNIHEYCIPNTLLNSSVFISIPKLKTHRKVGVTVNIKGLVGIAARKNWLIHWRIGFPGMGGDEYPAPPRQRDYLILLFRHILNDFLPEKLYFWLRQKTKGTFLSDTFQTEKSPSGRRHRGAWEGNDTCWRMAVDLYNLFVKDKTEWIRCKKNSLIKTFSVVDAVTAGEGNGPFCPEEKLTNVIISGEDLSLVDATCVRLMDFSLKRVKYLNYLLEDNKIDLDKIEIISQDFNTDNFFNYNKSYFKFKPPDDWNNLTI